MTAGTASTPDAGSQKQTSVSIEAFEAADDARNAFLRDADANDQVGALDAALSAAFAADGRVPRRSARDVVEACARELEKAANEGGEQGFRAAAKRLRASAQAIGEQFADD